MHVTALDGRTWSVRRRWFPSPRRIRRGKVAKEAFRGLDLVDGNMSPAWALVIVGGVLLVALGPWLLPMILFLLQLVLFVVIIPAYVGLRLVFRQPWIVEALTHEPAHEVHRWAVVGLGASSRAIEEIAAAVRAGADPTPSVGVRLA